MKVCFFKETEIAYNRITELFDMIHPISISYANFRKIVNDYVGLNGAEQNILKQKYKVTGVISSNHINYKKSFIEQTNEEFNSKLAWLLLINIFSIFEGWLEDLKNNVFNHQPYLMDVKKIQFPDKVVNEINRLIGQISVPMEKGFFSKLKRGKHYNACSLVDVFKCYRFFKELRNDYCHNNNKITQKTIDAYNYFIQVNNGFGMNETFSLDIPILNHEYKIKLRDAIIFSILVLKTIVTIDANLCKGLIGEKIVEETIIDSGWNTKMCISSDPDKAKAQCARICHKAGLIEPERIDEIKKFIVAKNLIKSL